MAALLLASCCRETCCEANAEVLKLSNHPQLFLDDYVVSSMANLRRDLKHPAKHPRNPLMVSEYPWEKRFMFVSSVVYNSGKFMAWYTASESPEGMPEYYTCYAESEDGIHWKKPLIGESIFGSHEKHNVLNYGASTFLDVNGANSKEIFRSVDSAYSYDGIHWIAHEPWQQNWRTAIGKNDTVTSFVFWKGTYLAYVRYQGPETGTAISDLQTGHVWKNATMRCVGLTTSKDYCHWTNKELIFKTDQRDGYPWVQPHALCVSEYGDVLIGLLPLLHLIPEDENNFLGDFDVQLMVSRDGWNWDRVADRAIFMPCDIARPILTRNWDFRFHPTANFLVKDDVVYIYYFGTNIRHGEGRSTGIGQLANTGDGKIEDRMCGLGLATIPADRFLSLQPVNWAGEGVLETKPFKFSGALLIVNADLNGGKLRIEVVDENGQAMPGYGREQSRLAVYDPLRYSVTWKQQDGNEKGLGQIPKGQSIALRFLLDNSELYSFQINS